MRVDQPDLTDFNIVPAVRAPISNGVHFVQVNPAQPVFKTDKPTLRSFSVFVLHFFELGIDDVVAAGRATLRSRTRWATSARRSCGARAGPRALLRRIC